MGSMQLSEYFRAVEALPCFWHVMRSMSNLTDSAYDRIFARLVKELKKVIKIELNLTALHFPRGGGFDALGKALQQSAYPRLKVLEITRNAIDCEGVEELASALKMGNLLNLRVLSFTNCSINAAGAEALAEAMQLGKLTRLQTFRIDENPIGSKGLMAVAALLGSDSLPSIKSLALSFQAEHDPQITARVTEQISMQALEALRSALRSEHLSLLQDLTLRHITQKGLLAYIMEVLESAFKLRSFTLADSDVGEAEGEVLASAFHSTNFSSSLLSLTLGRNKWVGDDGLAVKATIEGFKSRHLSALEILSMETSGSKVHQSIEDKDLADIAQLLEKGHLPSLKTLHAQYISTYHMARLSPPAVIRAYQNNPFLVAEVIMDWPSASLRDTADRLRTYNQKLVKRWKRHRIERQVCKSHLKVLFCGHPKVGRSTLRRALCRSQWEALITSKQLESRNGPTMPYEVSQIVQKKFVLRLWDTDFPQILLADGAPTVFVVVCSANYCQSAQENKSQAKQELLHWLNHIASTCVEGTQGGSKRQVMVVLNSFGGDYSCHDEVDWTSFLTLYSDIYEESLNICPSPFILNALSRKEVMRFREILIDFARFRTWTMKNNHSSREQSIALTLKSPLLEGPRGNK